MAKLPDFKSEKEVFEFFESHSSADFMDGAQLVKGPVVDKRSRKEITTIRLDPNLKLSLRKIAKSKGIRYQTLISMWLTERAMDELTHPRLEG